MSTFNMIAQRDEKLKLHDKIIKHNVLPFSSICHTNGTLMEMSTAWIEGKKFNARESNFFIILKIFDFLQNKKN